MTPRPFAVTRLSDIGRRVGAPMLELLSFREKGGRRETKLNDILLFLVNVVWKVRQVVIKPSLAGLALEGRIVGSWLCRCI